MSASTQRVFEIPSRISVFLLNASCFLNLSLDPRYHLLYICRPACLPRTAAPALYRDPNVPRNCKIARKCGSVQSQALRARSVVRKSRGGSSSKLCQSVYRRRAQVWRMDLSEMGAEFGIAGIAGKANVMHSHTRLWYQYTKLVTMQIDALSAKQVSKGAPCLTCQ